jgi:hypothetical protein
MLHHLLAPLVLEIDVDVGRLVAVARDEAFEKKIAALRVDVGDPEAVAEAGSRPSLGPGRGCLACARTP